MSGEEQFADERRRLESQIETLRDELAAIDQLKRTVKYQRRLIQDVATRPLVVADDGKTQQRLDTAELGNLFDLVGVRLQMLDERVLKADIRQREVNKTIAELQRKIDRSRMSA